MEEEGRLDGLGWALKGGGRDVGLRQASDRQHAAGPMPLPSVVAAPRCST